MLLKPHIDICKLASLGSADEQSDEVVEESEEEPAHESDELVTKGSEEVHKGKKKNLGDRVLCMNTNDCCPHVSA